MFHCQLCQKQIKENNRLHHYKTKTHNEHIDLYGIENVDFYFLDHMVKLGIISEIEKTIFEDYKINTSINSGKYNPEYIHQQNPEYIKFKQEIMNDFNVIHDN